MKSAPLRPCQRERTDPYPGLGQTIHVARATKLEHAVEDRDHHADFSDQTFVYR
jgi:hypothetical protein